MVCCMSWGVLQKPAIAGSGFVFICAPVSALLRFLNLRGVWFGAHLRLLSVHWILFGAFLRFVRVRGIWFGVVFEIVERAGVWFGARLRF